jgi:uncharacterized phage-associated protein
MSYDPRAIANEFLRIASEQNSALSPMKLQKLVYYANGWNLAIKGKPLINEDVEAWRHGPVIRSLYREFREFGNQDITKPATETINTSTEPWKIEYRVVTPSVDDHPEEAEFTKQLLNKIWQIYGKYTAVQLSNATHQEGTPWHKVVSEFDGDVPPRTSIPASMIRAYFLETAKSRTISK